VLRRPPRRLIVVGAVLLVVVVALQATLRVSFEDVENAVDSAGVFAPIAYAVVLFLGLSVPFNPVSDVATVNAAALLFEPEVAVAATFVAHTVALTVNYLVAQRYGHVLLRLATGRGRSDLVDRLEQQISYRTVFVTRFMLPLTAIGIDIVSYLAGMRRLGFWSFFIVSIIPWTILSVVYFYSTAYLRDRSFILFFAPAVALVFGPSAVVVGWRRWRARGRPAPVAVAPPPQPEPDL
jgi:uncharacterized membrane protein YdjX (TVP38/TMEM64 family)